MQTIPYKSHLIHFNKHTGRGFVSYNMKRGFLRDEIKTIKEGRAKIDNFVRLYQFKIDQLKG